MKIYTSEMNEIVAVRSRPAWDTEELLTEYDIEDPIFEGKCDAYICGYRYTPMEDGGVCITPYKDWSMLDCIQQQYEMQAKENEMLRTENDELKSENQRIIKTMELAQEALDALLMGA